MSPLPSHVTHCIFLAVISVLLSTLPVPAWGSTSIQINAEHLKFTDGNQVTATGDVRLEITQNNQDKSIVWPSISADHLKLPDVEALLPQNTALQASQIQFLLAPLSISLLNFTMQYPVAGGEVRIQGDMARCDAQGCMLALASFFPCPHDGDFISLHAERMQLKAQQIQLKSPRIRLHSKTVLGLPSLRLVPNSQPGFLPPILGFSPTYGMKIGPRVHLPLTHSKNTTFETALRTDGGVENGVYLNGNQTWMSLRHLRDESDNRVAVQGITAATAGRSTIAVDTQLASDRTVIRELAFLPRDRAIQSTNSLFRIGVHGTSLAFDNQLRYSQWFPSDTDVIHSGQVHLGASFFPLLPPLPRLQPTLLMAVDRFVWTADAPFLTESRFQAIPALTIPMQFAALWSDIRVGALLQRRQTDKTGLGESRILPGATIRMGVPLIKTDRHLHHLMQPTATLHVATFQSGRSPSSPVDMTDAAATGSQLTVAIENMFGAHVYRPDFTFTPSIHWHAKKNAPILTTPFWGLHAMVRRGWFQTEGNAALNSQTRRLNSARVTLSIDDNTNAGYSATLFYSARNARNAATFFPAVAQIWPVTLPRIPEKYTLLSQQLRLKLTERVRLIIDAQVALNPGIRLSALFYELEAATPCRCIVASITAAHRPDHLAPDIMLNLSWRPGNQ